VIEGIGARDADSRAQLVGAFLGAICLRRIVFVVCIQ
jgi:hypothetical protein